MWAKNIFLKLFSLFLGHFRAGIFFEEIIYFSALDLKPAIPLRPALFTKPLSRVFILPFLMGLSCT
jgi:hypothetical protein